ncbi:MAG: Co2+/Mg2+ efflux protein ApaG [Alphaproteobacteria bacterium]
MYEKTTNNIKVMVNAYRLKEESNPEESAYAWSYHVKIKNEGDELVQLRRRHWKITDQFGLVSEVRGAGVTGEQPILRAGEMFEYTSGTYLKTPTGRMVGTYKMQKQDGTSFDVDIPVFFLETHEKEEVVN